MRTFIQLLDWITSIHISWWLTEYAKHFKSVFLERILRYTPIIDMRRRIDTLSFLVDAHNVSFLHNLNSSEPCSSLSIAVISIPNIQEVTKNQLPFWKKSKYHTVHGKEISILHIKWLMLLKYLRTSRILIDSFIILILTKYPMSTP